MTKPGARFTRWVVLSDLGRINGSRMLRCVCDCGNEKDVSETSLRQGKSLSCGCLRNEKTSERNAATLKSGGHAKRRSPEYSSWSAMLTRCYNASAPNYHKYGGRGVSVCDRWRNSFASFLEDMGARPAGTSLDRIDGRGGYEPGNCRWATAIEQRHNRVKS